MKIMFSGDSHGDPFYLSLVLDLAVEQKVDRLIVVGDFGWFPEESYFPNDVDFQGVDIHWIDGNHEDHRAILEGRLPKGVTYHPRGSMEVLEDGTRLLYLGGASSVDKNFRREGRDWFPEENMTREQIDLAKSHEGVDVFVTHEAPASLNMKGMPESWASRGYDFKSYGNREGIQEVIDHYGNIKRGFSGHWHYTCRYDMPNGLEWSSLGGNAERQPMVAVLDTKTWEVLGYPVEEPSYTIYSDEYIENVDEPDIPF